jgi:hypothetical protein
LLNAPGRRADDQTVTPSTDLLSWRQFMRTRMSTVAAFLALAAVLAVTVPDAGRDIMGAQFLLALVALSAVAVMAYRDGD